MAAADGAAEDRAAADRASEDRTGEGSATSDPRPLAGIRILSQAIVWAGPFGTLILSDLGAEVIEIESVQHFTPTRGNVRHIPPEQAQGSVGASFAARDVSEGFWNRRNSFNYAARGHKSITLDLTREVGRELFFELVRVSDAYLENNAAGVVDRLGVGWEAVSKANPRLVMASFPGFGVSGPYAHFKGYGATMEAVAGHTLVRGYRGAEPSAVSPTFHGDPNAGAHAAFALIAALIARERTGRGQFIEISQAEAIAHHVSYGFMDYSLNQRVQGSIGNRDPSMAPCGVFPCSGDDAWIAIAVPTDEAFAALCRELGQPALAADPRFADVVARKRNEDALEELVAAATAPHAPPALMARLQAVGIAAAIVYHQPDMFDDPHLQARGFFREIGHPSIGPYRYPGELAKLERGPADLETPAPTLGQHNAEILRGLLGVDEARYQQLIDDEVIGTAYLESARG
ncbi:MAG: CoA transferase [Chloroflexi bacterium]|nr:CoA transferase [Chloroflexota bacterium]MQC28094.1 CoA transferase [Chloroflexota bacterium]